MRRWAREMRRAPGHAVMALRVWLFLPLLSWSGRAGAVDVAGVDVVVTRGRGAEDCPTQSEIAELLRPELHGEPAKGEARPVRVVAALTREGAGYIAHVRGEGSDGARGERVLNAPGPTCGALAQALLVTLVLLCDVSTPVALPPAPPPPEKAPAAPPSASAALPAPPAHPLSTLEADTPPDDRLPLESTETEPTVSLTSGRAVELWAAAGGGATSGLPHVFGAALGAAIEARIARWSFGADAVWTPEIAVSYPPGKIILQTWGGVARGCFAIVAPPPEAVHNVRVRGCADAMFASLHGDGVNFDRDVPQNAFWFLLGAGLDAEVPVAAWWAIGLQASALVPLQGYAFTVNGVRAYETDAVVGWLEASLRLRIW
jgi:hypothetical protein